MRSRRLCGEKEAPFSEVGKQPNTRVRPSLSQYVLRAVSGFRPNVSEEQRVSGESPTVGRGPSLRIGIVGEGGTGVYLVCLNATSVRFVLGIHVCRLVGNLLTDSIRELTVLRLYRCVYLLPFHVEG